MECEHKEIPNARGGIGLAQKLVDGPMLMKRAGRSGDCNSARGNGERFAKTTAMIATHGPTSRTIRRGHAPMDGERTGWPASRTLTRCFALALWNGHDPILKQRLFGLTNSEGNYGEEYYFTADWVLHKALIIGETRDLTLRSEVYNVFNTTNLNLPNGGVDAGVGSTGRITSLYSPMRQMQLGMRFQF